VSTVVLCGSLGSTSEMWEPQLAALGQRFDVIPIDHPGHGGAPVIEVRDVRDLARRVLEQVRAERFSFAGLSLGGAVGMRLALDAPGRMDRLVLVCTSARFGEPQMWKERAALVRAEGLEAIVDAVLERWFTPSFPDVRRYREMFLSTDVEGYARCCDALAGWDARDEVAGIGARTLVLSGAEDPSAPPEHGALLASRIPGARHEILQNARHLANVERADELNRLLLEYLA
jgi:3-oxoadipate enol-lactonase